MSIYIVRNSNLHALLFIINLLVQLLTFTQDVWFCENENREHLIHPEIMQMCFSVMTKTTHLIYPR